MARTARKAVWGPALLIGLCAAVTVSVAEEPSDAPKRIDAPKPAPHSLARQGVLVHVEPGDPELWVVEAMGLRKVCVAPCNDVLPAGRYRIQREAGEVSDPFLLRGDERNVTVFYGGPLEELGQAGRLSLIVGLVTAATCTLLAPFAAGAAYPLSIGGPHGLYVDPARGHPESLVVTVTLFGLSTVSVIGGVVMMLQGDRLRVEVVPEGPRPGRGGAVRPGVTGGAGLHAPAPELSMRTPTFGARR